MCTLKFQGLGAKVIAAAGSQNKLDIVKKYGGADYTINYTKPGWQKDVLQITNDKGVDVIYDPVVSVTSFAVLSASRTVFRCLGNDHRFVQPFLLTLE